MPRLLSIAALFLVVSMAAAAELRVKVLDAHGASIAGAVVEVSCGKAPARALARSADEAGQIRLACEAPATLRVSATGFEPFTRKLDSLPAGEFVVTLHPAKVLTTVNVTVQEMPGVGPSVGNAVTIDRSGARTVFDAVEKLVPSAYVTRRGVMGYGISTNGTGVVSIRGVGEQPNAGVLVVVDGRPDYQGLFGHPLPDFYSLSDVESVKVVEGPASVLYGSNAMGGLIEITPSRPRRASETRLMTSLGSYLTGQHRFAHGARWKRGFYSFTAGVSHTDGDRPNSAFHSEDSTLAVGYDLSERWKTSLEGRYGYFHVADPGPVSAPLTASYAAVGRGGFSANLDNTSGRTWGYVRLYSSYGRNFITDGFRSVDSMNGLRVEQTVALAPNVTFEGGTDLARFGGRARDVDASLDYGEHHIASAAGFSRAEWTPTSRLRFESGVRYDHNSQYGGITVPEFGAMFRLASNYSLAATVARGFRNPTLRELYLFPAPNPLLEPETLWNYQLTFQAHPRSNLSTWTTFYYADLSNLIVTTGRFPNLALSNAGRAINKGFEASAVWKILPRLSLNSGYAFLRSTNLAPYVPQNKLNYSLDWDARFAFLHFGGMTVGRTWADPAHAGQLGGYTVGTLKVSFFSEKPYNLFLMVDNLFNKRYQVVPGYPMPGINAMAGLGLHF
jgi:outer membrane cobalamin receptor